jgi:hypothetical protein
VCDETRSIPGPRWGALYALLLLALGAAVLARFVLPAAWRGLASWSLGLAAVAGVAQWIRGNRVALDQAEWCACASASTRVRTIASSTPVEVEDVEEDVAAALH